MRFRLGRCLVVLAVVLATGMHWFLLQSVAWVGMTVAFSRTETLSTALHKTFDGDHPCGLCKFVDEGRKAERKPEMQPSQIKLDLFCESTASPAVDPQPFCSPSSVPLHLRLYCDSPPVPPPRHV